MNYKCFFTTQVHLLYPDENNKLHIYSLGSPNLFFSNTYDEALKLGLFSDSDFIIIDGSTERSESFIKLADVMLKKNTKFQNVPQASFIYTIQETNKLNYIKVDITYNSIVV